MTTLFIHVVWYYKNVLLESGYTTFDYDTFMKEIYASIAGWMN